MPVIFQKWIMRDDLKNNPEVLYVFGDNLKRVGLGGQAKEMRGEPNAVGVATKKAPGMGDKDFFSDEEFLDNIITIERDFMRAFNHLVNGGIVVIPADGLGTGLSELPTRAPETNSFLTAKIDILKAL